MNTEGKGKAMEVLPNDDVVGIIVPVSSEITNRIFHHHEVYALLSPSGSSKLKVGGRIFFCDTGGRGLEGEASIEKIAFEPAKDIKKRYGRDFYLSEEELNKYLSESGANENSTMLVIVTGGATKYSRPLGCNLQVGMEGQYVTPDVFKSIMAENSVKVPKTS
jgi:hypothetical protein